MMTYRVVFHQSHDAEGQEAADGDEERDREVVRGVLRAGWLHLHRVHDDLTVRLGQLPGVGGSGTGLLAVRRRRVRLLVEGD